MVPPRRRESNEMLLLDPFPKTAAVRDIWENELALIKCERVGAIAAAERQRQRFAFDTPMADHWLPALVRGDRPIFYSAIGIKNQMLVYGTGVTDRSFSPMTDQPARIVLRRGA